MIVNKNKNLGGFSVKFSGFYLRFKKVVFCMNGDVVLYREENSNLGWFEGETAKEFLKKFKALGGEVSPE